MKSARNTIYIFTVFLIGVIVFFFHLEWEWNGEVSLSVTLSSDGYTEEVFCWKDDAEETDNHYYVFLPSYAELSEATVNTYTYDTVFLNGQRIKNGTTLDAFQFNVPYELQYESGSDTYSYTLTFMQSANIPTLYIHTASGEMEYIHTVKGNEETGEISLYSADGKLEYGGFLESVKGRGNSTWDNEKKPYNIKLFQEADLLGMGKAQTWVLLAEYSDESYMKNKMTYDFAETVGMAYSPDSEWVDLYLNGQYAGLYLLCEHVEVHPERVDIEAEGSFLVSIEGENRLREQNLPFVSWGSDRALRIRFAGMEIEELDAIWQCAEKAIMSEDGIDSQTGKSWDQLIDVDSWAMRYLMDEVFANSDGGYISQFFFYDGGKDSGKIYAGPVWDMDLTLGAFGWAWQSGSPYALFAGRPHLSDITEKPLYYMLMQKKEFAARVVELYQTVFLPALSDLLNEKMEQYALKIAQAVEMERIRWGGRELANCVEYNRAYLQERIIFLNDLWLENGKYFFVEANPNDYNVWGCFAVRPGEYLPELPQKDGYGWYRYDTDTLFDVTQPIWEDLCIYLSPLPAEGSTEAEYTE